MRFCANCAKNTAVKSVKKLEFFEMLKPFGLEPVADKTVLVRHTLNKEDVPIANYIRRSPENLAKWQCIQRKHSWDEKTSTWKPNNHGTKFWGCDVVVSFRADGETGNNARFVGVFQNKSGDTPPQIDKAEGVDPELDALYRVYRNLERRKLLHVFNFQKVEGFEELENRVVINWGKDTINWVKKFKTGAAREVVEIRRKDRADRVVMPFPGMGKVLLSFDEMAEVVNSPAVYGDWHAALKSSNGVYLILYEGKGERKGQIYVGSAYGEGGILGRWQTYAETPHGNNAKLKALLRENKDAYHEFKFSILQQLPESTTQGEAIDCEKFWKDKLGSRAFGLNSN